MTPAPPRLTPETKPLTRSERLVLAHIAMYCDENRHLVQSTRYIAEATFLSHTAVRKAIDRLNERQLIWTTPGTPTRSSEHLFVKWDLGRSERGNLPPRFGPASGRSPRVRVKTVAGGAR